MKKMCVVLILLLGSLLAGCHGMVDSYAERKIRLKQISELQMRMLVDDLDYLLLIDRSSTLTEYHPHIGR